MNDETPLLAQSNSGILLSDVWKTYDGKNAVLHGVNLHVERGTVYGLLGASGSGKSTLLKLILGRLEPDEGVIEVLGKPPHTPHHPIPGHAVGYAPQETALYNDLSIKETLMYHASLHQLSSEEFDARRKYLLDFLDLPDDSKVVTDLSGGQQRRVSLAAALLHGPELLILDEPTVGLDPLLRARIWEYLRSLAKTGVTVIVTTHYIDEAREADRVGLMRHGRILVEDAPNVLLRRFGYDSLEDVFLKICRDISKKPKSHQPGELFSPSVTPEISSTHSHVAGAGGRLINSADYEFDHEKGNGNGIHHRGASKSANDDLEASEAMRPLGKPKAAMRPPSILRRPKQVLGTTRRKFTQIIRNWKLLAWEILVPTIQICAFMLAVGADPKNLPLVVVNQDQGLTGYPSINAGRTFVDDLITNHSDSIHVIQNVTVDGGTNLIRNGEAWGMLVIPPHLTDTLVQIGSSGLGNRTLAEVLPEVQYQLFLDMSNYQVDLAIIQTLGRVFSDLSMKFANQTLSPLILEQPIYGSLDFKFSSYLAPGIITSICFAQSIGTTAMAFVRERNNGCLDRVFAAGVPSTVLIVGSLLTHSSLLILQAGIMLIISVYVFKVTVLGSVVLVFFVQFLLGIVGQSFGLFVSAFSHEEREAVQFTLAAFFPSLLLSGVLWPLEAIPPWFVWISKSLPTTWSAAAVRSIMLRGWGIDHFEIWFALIVSFCWVVFFLGVAAIRLSSREFLFRCACCKPKIKKMASDDVVQ